MDLLAKLQDDMKAAMRSGQKDRLTVIRMLISDVKNIDLNPQKPTPQQAIEAYAKKLRKSVEEYEKLGKPDEVAKLRSEVAIVEEYLPRKLSADETERLVAEFLGKTSYSPQQIGQATGAFMKEHGGKVDASLASAAIRKRLSS